MESIKVLIINDEGEDIQLEKELIAESFDVKPEALTVKYVSAADAVAVRRELPEADGIISVYTDFDEETLTQMKKCKIIATQTIGINTIDLKAATNLGICVTNVPDYCVEEVAMHTVTLALSCTRKITTYDKIASDKVWNVDDIYRYGQLHRLQDQTYGLVSFGNIARRVAELMGNFGMKLMAFDPFLDDETFAKYGVQRADSLEELFANCNIISLHTPLTPKTEGMIDYDLMKRMPEGGILINTSRGAIVKEEDLYRVLKEGRLGAAGVDVIIDESHFDSPLYELDNVIITPHVAYYSEEALTECRRKAALQVADVIAKHRIPRYLVNKDVKGATREALA